MTSNEKELLSLIRESDNHFQALVTAVEIVSTFLERSESYQAPSADSLRELA